MSFSLKYFFYIIFLFCQNCVSFLLHFSLFVAFFSFIAFLAFVYFFLYIFDYFCLFSTITDNFYFHLQMTKQLHPARLHHHIRINRNHLLPMQNTQWCRNAIITIHPARRVQMIQYKIIQMPII